MNAPGDPLQPVLPDVLADISDTDEATARALVELLCLNAGFEAVALALQRERDETDANVGLFLTPVANSRS